MLSVYTNGSKEVQEVIGRVEEVITLSHRIPLRLTRPGQLNSGCKRTFQSSSLPRIGPQESLRLTRQESQVTGLSVFVRIGEDAMPQTTP
ncbi:unnamed protein product [Nezara viridula]|uniref:Uncharacterized protein n=1 Tax=Nezara viridula TaxID=85310 RepID=A0A9P0E8S6_NEZVI|nr:unnamed protein product [Nezara viridula]